MKNFYILIFLLFSLAKGTQASQHCFSTISHINGKVYIKWTQFSGPNKLDSVIINGNTFLGDYDSIKGSKLWIGTGSYTQRLVDTVTLFETNGTPYTCYTNLISLPVTITTFKAEVFKYGTKLIWQTASESNNSGFYVERSNDLVAWQTIYFMRGAGDAQTTTEYTYTDQQREGGYYRLRQTDFNGKYEYSVTVAAKQGDIYAFAVYPNPSSGSVTVETVEETLFALYDFAGRECYNKMLPAGRICLYGLPMGTFNVVIRGKDGKSVIAGTLINR